MIQVLLDINVILDVLQKRNEHYEEAAKVISLCSNNHIKGYISAISFGTLHYILSKTSGKTTSLSSLKKIRAFTSVAAVDSETIDLAIASNFSDFEDAIQYYSAVRSGLDQIITRNKKDFSKAKLSVSTPQEFLAMFAERSTNPLVA
jgi:predicted nucleic acid-binding protein